MAHYNKERSKFPIRFMINSAVKWPTRLRSKVSSLGKILTNNFGSQKNDRFEKILGQEIFSGSKNIVSPKKIWPWKMWVWKKNLVSKRYESEK